MTPEQLRQQAEWYRARGMTRTAELAEMAAKAQERSGGDFTPQEMAEITEQ
jgi:hypothetical protein